MGTQIMRLREVLAVLGISRATLWRRVRDGQFPPPVRLGGTGTRTIGWKSSEVERWIEELRSSAEKN